MTLVLVAAGGGADAAEEPSWDVYGAESYVVESTGYRVVADGAQVVSATAALAVGAGLRGYETVIRTSGARPAENPEGAASACWFVVSAPFGKWDRETGSLSAEVNADVSCDFDSPEINYRVQFTGHDPASGSFVESGNNSTCRETSHCRGAASYHYTSRACNGSFDHYGVAYGSYRKPNGAWATIDRRTAEGPHKSGKSFSSYC